MVTKTRKIRRRKRHQSPLPRCHDCHDCRELRTCKSPPFDCFCPTGFFRGLNVFLTLLESNIADFKKKTFRYSFSEERPSIYKIVKMIDVPFSYEIIVFLSLLWESRCHYITPTPNNTLFMANPSKWSYICYICINFYPTQHLQLNDQSRSVQNPCDIPLYCLVTRDPYNGLWYCNPHITS